MSRYIDAEAMIANALQDSERSYLELVAKHTPSIDLDDYVPKEFHDKTCEAMAKRHQEEIADMVSVVRCKECVHGTWHEQTEMYICSANDQDLYEAEHFCSYGDRKESE